MTLQGGTNPRFDPTRVEPGDSSAVTYGEGMDATGRFLKTEEGATARLMGFYRQARLEIQDFLSHSDSTPNQAEYYRRLQAQTDEVVERLQAGSTQWANDTITPAFVEGAKTANPDVGFETVHAEALHALSQDTLSLITNTNEGIRRSVQQSVASGILEGLSAEQIRSRMIAGGLQPGPWRTVEERAGVIARTETMRAYNAGNIVGVQQTGAPFVEWIAADDEKTCEICGPRDGKRYRTPGFDPSRLMGGEVVPNAAPSYELGKIGKRPEADGKAYADLPDDEREAFVSKYGSQGVPSLGSRNDAALHSFSSDFASKYQASPIERGAILSPDGTLLYEAGGISLEQVAEANKTLGLDRIGGEVDWGDDAKGLFRGNIVTHTHPGANTPLSDGDVASSIAQGSAEIRAEARDYSFRLRPGRADGQWTAIDPTKSFAGDLNNQFRKVYDDALETISNDEARWSRDGIRRKEAGFGFEDAAGKDVAIEEYWLDQAWVETASSMGWVYEKVPHDRG